jgi:hypothetical protein
MLKATHIPVAIVSAFLMVGQPIQAFAQSNATIRNEGKRASASGGVTSHDAQRRALASPATDSDKKKADLEKEIARQKAELEKLKREAEENDRSGFEKLVGGLHGDDGGRGTAAAGIEKNKASPAATRSKDSVKDSVVPCATAGNPCKQK